MLGTKYGAIARRALALVVFSSIVAQQAVAWGVDGHHMVNRVAGMNLPADMPAFMRTTEALDALEYYAPEPDHWRGKGEPELASESAPDHFIALERVALLGPLPRTRYEYVRALVTLQAAHPDLPLTVERMGTQPYQTVEVYEKLKSAMRDYRSLSANKQNAKPLEAEILFLAGILGTTWGTARCLFTPLFIQTGGRGQIPMDTPQNITFMRSLRASSSEQI